MEMTVTDVCKSGLQETDWISGDRQTHKSGGSRSVFISTCHTTHSSLTTFIMTHDDNERTEIL